MQRPMSLALLLSLLLVSGGCVKVAVGSGSSAGVGVYSYLEGALKAVYDVPIQPLALKVLTALESLRLTLDNKAIDGLGGVINLRRGDGTAVVVHLKPTSQDGTLVSVRVGTFGNKDESLRIHQIIHRELGT